MFSCVPFHGCLAPQACGPRLWSKERVDPGEPPAPFLGSATVVPAFSVDPHFLSSQECIFTKQESNSVLHVVYEGNLQVGLCKDCCKRWYFVFDDVECKTPGPIDAVMSGGLSLDYPFYSYGRIEGFCETRFPSGPVRVGLQMENCPTYASSPTPHNLQLYNRYGSILIQEVSPSQ